jgi:hypothetical protein
MPCCFTPYETNAVLDEVRPLMEEVVCIRMEIQARQPELRPAIQSSVGNGGSAELSKLFVEFERLDVLVQRIHEAGMQIKDLNVGLMDFPAFRQGREVFLCWRYGEDGIELWHELNAGFASRQMIDWD